MKHALFFALALACSGESIVAPDDGPTVDRIVGTWELVGVNGQTLPHNPTNSDLTIRGATLVVTEGKWSETLDVCGQSCYPMTFDGTWTKNGTSYFLRYYHGPFYGEVTVTLRELTMSDESGWIMKYRKLGPS